MNEGALSVAVLGGGRWARALLGLLTENQQRAPERISQVMHHRDGAEFVSLAAADLLILAVPAAATRPLLRRIAPSLHGAQFLIHAVGSLAPPEASGGRALISEVVHKETPLRRIGALAGPALAQDLEARREAALVCGSRFDEVLMAARQVLSAPSLLVYTTRDQLGVEVARAMVAVVALAGGIATGLELGSAARAILLSRGAAEVARLGVALGASERTFFGLAGIGEMVAATDGPGSADFELGRHLGKGMPLGQAQKLVGRVCDGPNMLEEALRLAATAGLRLPLMAALSRLLAETCTCEEALHEFFASHPASE